MEPQLVRELLLTEPKLLTTPTEIASEDLLQLPGHGPNCRDMLPIGLQTYK